MLSLFGGRAIVGRCDRWGVFTGVEEHLDRVREGNPNLALVLSLTHPPCLVLYGTSSQSSFLFVLSIALSPHQSHPKSKRLMFNV